MLATTGTLPGIEVRLHPEVVIEGRIYGPDGQPLSGVAVALAPNCQELEPLSGNFVRSGEDGSYRLTGVDSEAALYLEARFALPDGTLLRAESTPLSRVVSPVPGRVFWWDLHLMPFDPKAIATCSE